MNKLRMLLTHIVFITSAMFVVFLILDRFNPVMAFVNNDISTGILWVFSISAFILAVLNILNNKQK